jgi:hypothetical protein
MLPPRRPMTPTMINRTPGGHFTPHSRTRIVERYNCGFTPAAIALGFNLLDSAVRYTIEQSTVRNNNASIPKAPRHKAYNRIDERNILRYVHLFPKATYVQVKRHTGVLCSTSTIKKILKAHGIVNRRAKRRPFLSPKVAAKRLAWCLRHQGYTAEEWGLFMWSDECSVERGRGKVQEWVFRNAAQKWNRKMIMTYKASKDICVMVWGCFWDHGRSDLYVLDRDFESKKHGYSANSYIEVLDAQLAPWYEELDDEGYIFMQDNAPIHTAHKVRDWFLEKGIRVIDWPPYSPDLNPIEHIWWVLKRMLHDDYPHLDGTGEDDIEEMQEALKDCWARIPKETFDKLYESMPRRVAACIKARGWHTKY